MEEPLTLRHLSFLGAANQGYLKPGTPAIGPDVASTPAVQLVERVEAPREVGEERQSRAPVLPRIFRRYRAQQLRDRGISRIAVPLMKEFEDLLLEVLQAQVAETHAAGATRAEHDVTLCEFRPSAEEPRGFECRGWRLDPGGFRAPCHRVSAYRAQTQ